MRQNPTIEDRFDLAPLGFQSASHWTTLGQVLLYMNIVYLLGFKSD